MIRKRQTKALWLTLCFVISLFACTLYKTPRVEDAYYKNFEYGFRFQLPTGWQVLQSMPDALAAGLAGQFEKNMVVLLLHPQKKGMIIVQADKSDFDMAEIGYSKEQFKEKLKTQFTEKEKEIMESEVQDQYTYQISSLKVKAGFGPSLLVEESAVHTSGEKYASRTYLNHCQEKRTCEIRFTLVSKEKDFDRNYPAFIKISNSAKKVYR